LPQGLPKKIQFHLLLADLALQVADALASRLEILHSHRLCGGVDFGRTKHLARSARGSQGFRPTTPKVLTPLV
jgi:hypothetical protein